MSGQITAKQLTHLSRSKIIKTLDALVLKRGSGKTVNQRDCSAHTIWTFGGEGLVVEVEEGKYYFGDGNYYTVNSGGKRVFYASDNKDPHENESADFRCTARDMGMEEEEAPIRRPTSEPPSIPYDGWDDKMYIHEYSPGEWEEKVKGLARGRAVTKP